MIDKLVEQNRYELRSKQILDKSKVLKFKNPLNEMPIYLHSPYEKFIEIINSYIDPSDYVLEIGAGKGEFTEFLIRTKANIIATDISTNSVKIVNTIFKDRNNLTAQVADMEYLPFEDKTFDVLICCGSLSYGDGKKIINEIQRVLKENGRLILVDSLNNNLIYSLNRYIHYIAGRRSISVIKRCPTIKFIEEIKDIFHYSETFYFGKLSWIMPVVSKFTKDSKNISDNFDKFIKSDWPSFKFVLNASIKKSNE